MTEAMGAVWALFMCFLAVWLAQGFYISIYGFKLVFKKSVVNYCKSKTGYFQPGLFGYKRMLWYKFLIPDVILAVSGL